jgi:hypothetical protein
MNVKLKFTTFFFIIFFTFIGCESSSSSSNSLAASLLTYPIITSIEPRFVNSTFAISGITYPATTLTISGRNFSAVTTDNIVLFNGISANVISSTTTEISTLVPDGVYSGVVTVSKVGGSCTSIDNKSGINCGGSDLYVSCYAPFKEEYGSEILLSYGTQNSITFTESIGTKAFRIDLVTGTKSMLLNCPNNMTVTLFSKTCSPSITQDIVPSNITPQLTFDGGYTLQFFVTTQAGDCKITVY